MRFLLFVLFVSSAYLSYLNSGKEWTFIGLFLLFAAGMQLGIFIEQNRHQEKQNILEKAKRGYE